MRKVVEIYVKTDKLPVGARQGYELIVPGHECTRKAVTRVIMENVLPEVQRTAVELLEESCNETGAELRVYDTCTFIGRLRARLEGVKEIPTIISGNNRIEGTAERSQILYLLK